MPHPLTEMVQANAPEVTSKINAALDKVGEYIEAGEDLVAAQAPILIQEILDWAVVSHGLWLLVGVTMLLCPLFMQRYLRKASHLPEYRRNYSGALDVVLADWLCFSVIMFGIVAPCIGAMVVLGNIGGFLKPLVAPRMYLIEYFSQLVR